MESQSEEYWFNYIVDYDPKEIQNTIHEEYIISQEKKIHLDIYGHDDADLRINVIFIHGTAVYSKIYAEFCYALYKEGYRVIAPDLPGHGLSEGKRGHFTMKEFAATLYDVTSYIIERYGENVVVMGSSLGGITALYAVANDQRIKAGICHNAAIFNEGAHKKIVNVKGVYKILKPLVPFFARILPTLRISVWVYLDAYKLVQDKWLDKVDILLADKLLTDRYTLKSILTQMREPLAHPAETIETPIMIINGSNDVLFSVEYMQEILDRLEKSLNKKLEIIPNSAHLILQEHREESLKRITEWLQIILK
jgi:alpha-beta hydrolase superfamily lysophospholipase